MRSWVFFYELFFLIKIKAIRKAWFWFICWSEGHGVFIFLVCSAPLPTSCPVLSALLLEALVPHRPACGRRDCLQQLGGPRCAACWPRSPFPAVGIGWTRRTIGVLLVLPSRTVSPS